MKLGAPLWMPELGWTPLCAAQSAFEETGSLHQWIPLGRCGAVAWKRRTQRVARMTLGLTGAPLTACCDSLQNTLATSNPSKKCLWVRCCRRGEIAAACVLYLAMMYRVVSDSKSEPMCMSQCLHPRNTGLNQLKVVHVLTSFKDSLDLALSGRQRSNACHRDIPCYTT